MDQRVTSLQERLAARRDMYATGPSSAASNGATTSATGYSSSRATPGRKIWDKKHLYLIAKVPS